MREVKNKAGKKRYEVRWREGGQHRSRWFTRKDDARTFEMEVTRRRQLGPVALRGLDAGKESLDEYVTEVWAKTHAGHLAPGTKATYSWLYDTQIAPFLGGIALRDLTPDDIAQWQARRLEDGAGPETTRKAITLLGNILQRAFEGQYIAANPQRMVRKKRVDRTEEVRPLPPAAVEMMRQTLLHGTVLAKTKEGKRPYTVPVSMFPLRDATIVSVLAYAGLRPQEMIGLTWGAVGKNTINVFDPKTGRKRSVRLLAPLKADLAEWRASLARPRAADYVFPNATGESWTKAQYQSWARRSFKTAATRAGHPDASPYTARHSFASLLLHEGRSVIYVARQMGHSAALTLKTYGHVIEELDGEPQLDAEEAIERARRTAVFGEGPMYGQSTVSGDSRTSEGRTGEEKK